MKLTKKSVATTFMLLLCVLIVALLIVGTNSSASVTSAFSDMQDEQVEDNLDVSQTNIEDGIQLVVQNIQEYKNSLKQKLPNIKESELKTNILKSAGYTSNEIQQMSEEAKESLLESKDLTIQRTASTVNNGLNMTVTYSTRTLVLGTNLNMPVDYYFVNVIWSWANPSTLVGSPDYISINLEQNKNSYELLMLNKDSDLAKYEYCNFTYNRKTYRGASVVTDYGFNGKAGEVLDDIGIKNHRSVALQMPKNVIQYDVPSDDLVYKQVYTDFKGEAQFILQINAPSNEGVSQLVGITYGHSTKEYEATYSENNSVSLGLSVDVKGPTLGMGFQNSSGWTYTETDKIDSSVTLFTLGYNKINLVDGKVYNIVNLNAQKALEYAAGVTETGTPLKLSYTNYTQSDQNLSAASLQWKVNFNPNNNCVIIRPAKDCSKFIEFNRNNEVSIGENPSISAMSLSASSSRSAFRSPIRIAPYSYTIPQHNVQVSNCYKIQGSSNYGSVMNYKNDFYTTITYGEIGASDEARSSWIFYEVPQDKVVAESPTNTYISTNSVFRMKNVGTGKYMDVCNASLDYGADMLVYDRSNGFNQQFKLISASFGKYFIEPYHTIGFNLDVPNGNQASGQRIKTYGYNGYTAQQFRFYPIKLNGANAQFLITTVVTNNTKAIQGNPNLSVTQETINRNNNNQLWELEYVCTDTLKINATDSYFIRNKESKYYFDVSGSATKNNSELLQYDFKGSNNQIFKFDPNWEGSFYMIPQHATNRVVELKGESVNGYRLKLYSLRDDKPYQRFKFLRASSDSFYILTGASGYSKTVAVYGDVYMHKPLEQWDRNNTTAQQWVIEKYNNNANTQNTVYERCLTKTYLNVNSTNTMYFSAKSTGRYTIETVGSLNTTIKIYEYQSNGYVLKSTSTSGGVRNNAKLTISLNGQNQYKIEIIEAGGQSGNVGVIAYK